MTKLKIPPNDLPSFTDASGVTTGQGRLEHRLFLREQSWCYEALWAICGRKLRIMVTRNAYDMQSFCKVQAYDEASSEWKFLCDIPFNKALRCYGVSYTDTRAPQELFELDADTVLEKACRILNPFYASVAGPPEGVAQSPEGAGALKGGTFVTKVELVARVYFSDGTTVDRPVDRS